MTKELSSIVELKSMREKNIRIQVGCRVSLLPNCRKVEVQRTNQVALFRKVRGILFNQSPI